MPSAPEILPAAGLPRPARAAGDPHAPSRWRGLRRVVARPLGWIGLALVATVLAAALFADQIAPYDPLALNVRAKLQGPSAEHWFGTDQLGRDTLSRVIFGARAALEVAILAVGLAMSAGLLLGLVAGYGPRAVDAALVLCFDSMNSLPMIMFALAVITVLGVGIETLILVIVLVSIPTYARVVRAQTLALKRSEFVLAEKLIGASMPRIIFYHLLPNVLGPLMILVSMDIPVVIMLEAGLSFLGLGIRPPTPSWGSILNDGYANIRVSTTLVVAGGAPLMLATLGFTFLGEALRDAFDPKLAGRRL
jgi:peptide/nickel transport system permease protein